MEAVTMAGEDVSRRVADDMGVLVAEILRGEMAALLGERDELEFEHLPRIRRAMEVLAAHLREEAERPCGTVHRLEPGRRFPQDEGDHRA
jgi:hypothetical protein